jgi:hypothetical protein
MTKFWKLERKLEVRRILLKVSDVLSCGMVWYGMVWYGMVWYGMVWYGMVWYGVVWYGIVVRREFVTLSLSY